MRKNKRESSCCSDSEKGMLKEERKKKFHNLFKRMWERKVRYLFILPAVVSFFIFCYLPMLGLIIAWKDYSIAEGIFGSPWSSPFWNNFTMFFDNPLLGNMIRNTILVSLLKLLTGFPAPILFAILLNECVFKRFRGVAQIISYLPFLVSWVIVIAILNSLLAPTGHGGPLYAFINLFKGKEEVTYYTLKESWFYPLAISTNIWKGVGWNSIIYIAAMKNISPELYEAAEIDGASRLKQIVHITLPGILPTMCLLLLMQLGSLASAGYEQIYLLQSPNNLGLSNVLDVYIITAGLNAGNYEIATVAGLFQSLFALILTVGGNAIARIFSDNSLW